MGLFDYIDDRIKDVLSSRRMGFYVGVVSNAAQTLRRSAVDAEWGPTLQRIRRISSPILDIVPARGTRMAVLSQDGLPEFGAILGQIWDDLGTAEDMTVWLRAHLSDHPGHIELGAEKGVRIVVGDNTVDIEPVGSGRVEIIASGDVVVAPGGKVRLGSEKADDDVPLSSKVEDELGDVDSAIDPVISWYNDGIADAVAANSTVPAEFSPDDTPSPTYSSGKVGADKVTAE